MPKEKKQPSPKIDSTTLIFLKLIEDRGIPYPMLEHKFHPDRRWRIDYAWPEQKLAVEREGGVWTRGRHTRPMGFIKDLEKYNNLTMLGWRLLRFTPQQILSLESIKMIGTLLS